MDALPERAPYPLAQGLPELREAAAAWCRTRFGVVVDPDTEIVPTYGSKEAIFSLAQVLDTSGRTVVFGEPAYPVYERGAALRGRARAYVAADTRERLPARPRRAPASTTAIVWVNYPHNPTGATAPLAFYERLAELAAERELRRRLRRGVQRALVRRAPAVGAPDRGPLARRRLPHAEQALVDDRIPIGLRRCPAGDRLRAEVVPPDGRHGAAGVRAAGVRRRVERRAPRRGDTRALPGEARRDDPGDRGEGLGDRRERGDDVPLGRRPATADALLARGIIASPGELFGPSGAGYVRFALVPTLDECRARSGDTRGAVNTEADDRGPRPGRAPRRREGGRRMARQREREEGDPRLLPPPEGRADRGGPVRVRRQDPAQAELRSTSACASSHPRRRDTARFCLRAW